MPQSPIEFLRGAARDLDESIERGKGGLRADEQSLIGSIKEVIGYGERIFEKGLCLSSSKDIGSVGYICDGRWIIVRRGDQISISKVGNDIAISFTGSEFRVVRRDAGIIIGSRYFKIYLDSYLEEIGFNEYREASKRIYLVKKILPMVLEALRKADESFVKCAKLYRVKC
jgi:hypothetical protein